MESFTFWEQVGNNLLGDVTLVYFTSTLICILAGALTFMFLNAETRDRGSDHTPVTFSWKFYFKDNCFRIPGNIIVAIIIVRFYPDLFPDGDLTMFKAFLIGLGFDGVIVFVRELAFEVRNRYGLKIKKFNGDKEIVE